MASTTLIANLKTVIANGPSTVTKANAIAQAGPITDYVGMCNSVLTNLDEAEVKLNGVAGAAGLLALTDPTTDAANYTLLSNVLASLS